MKYITPDWPAPEHIKAYTTIRNSWGGRMPYHDLNKGNYTSGDQNYVAESSQLVQLLNLPNEPIWITQTHSTIVIPALPENKEQSADATFTDRPNQVCVVMTADCLPVLMCTRKGSTVAAIHAGWRGLAGGILEATLSAMREPTNEILVWLGPAIGPKKFEVGQDVYNAFVHAHPETRQAFLPTGPNKWLANLYQLAKIRLNSQGVTNIYGGQFCTYTQSELFFSYRRDQGRTGRMASLIWIAED